MGKIHNVELTEKELLFIKALANPHWNDICSYLNDDDSSKNLYDIDEISRLSSSLYHKIDSIEGLEYKDGKIRELHKKLYNPEDPLIAKLNRVFKFDVEAVDEDEYFFKIGCTEINEDLLYEVVKSLKLMTEFRMDLSEYSIILKDSIVSVTCSTGVIYDKDRSYTINLIDEMLTFLKGKK